MPKQITGTEVTTAQSDLTLLKSHEAALRAQGMSDLADVYKRAIREFQNPAFTGQQNTVGVTIALR